MVRLADIPKETLEQIQRFVQENKRKYPVTSSPKDDGSRIKTLVDIVEEKFGYRLSPSQIYALQKGYKVYRVKLDVDVIRELEERFGSVSKGLRQMLKFYKSQQIPPHLKEPYKVLLQKGELTPAEVEEVLLPFVKESREAWKIIAELSRLGYVTRDKNGNYIVHKFRRDPFVELAMGGFG
jgi:hypothetical protein